MEFYTKVAGVTFNNEGRNTENRQRIIAELSRNGALTEGTELTLRRDPSNRHDSNAVVVLGPDGRQIGFLPRDVAANVSPNMMNGVHYKAFVEAVTGGDAESHYGVNLKVVRDDSLNKTGLDFGNSFTYNGPDAYISCPICGKQIFELFHHCPYCKKQIVPTTVITTEGSVDDWIECAFNDSAWGQFHLGECYDENDNIKNHDQKALYWYEEAALKDYALAQSSLGIFYLTGRGTKINYPLAAYWLEKAAAHGISTALNNLAILYYEGNGVEKNYSKAFECWKEAAERGHAKAQYHLGLLCYYNGKGVEKNYELSKQWLLNSMKSGFKPAEDKYNELFGEQSEENEENGTTVPLDVINSAISKMKEEYQEYNTTIQDILGLAKRIEPCDVLKSNTALVLFDIVLQDVLLESISVRRKLNSTDVLIVSSIAKYGDLVNYVNDARKNEDEVQITWDTFLRLENSDRKQLLEDIIPDLLKEDLSDYTFFFGCADQLAGMFCGTTSSEADLPPYLNKLMEHLMNLCIYFMAISEQHLDNPDDLYSFKENIAEGMEIFNYIVISQWKR